MLITKNIELLLSYLDELTLKKGLYQVKFITKNSISTPDKTCLL